MDSLVLNEEVQEQVLLLVLLELVMNRVALNGVPLYQHLAQELKDNDVDQYDESDDGYDQLEVDQVVVEGHVEVGQVVESQQSVLYRHHCSFLHLDQAFRIALLQF